jgi:hypothetical protein
MSEKPKSQFEVQVLELVEYVTAFFTGRKTPGEEKKAFLDSISKSLREIPNMMATLDELPHYGAVAFLGSFQFANCAEVEALKKGGDKEKLAAIRAVKGVKIADGARPGWEALTAHSEDLACVILALCYVGESKPQIKKSLNKK